MRVSLGERVFDNQDGFEYSSAPKIQLAALLGFIGLSLLAGIASVSVTLVNINGWYAGLVAPLWVPPKPLPFAAWTLMAGLYVLMAVAAWRVWRGMNPMPLQRAALNAWGWQLALGAAWPAVFFGFHALLPALIISVALVLGVAVTVWRFAALNIAAAILLVPYLAWTGYTAYLNAGFWWLNH